MSQHPAPTPDSSPHVRKSVVRQVSSFVRTRLILISIHADRLATVLLASAASFLGVELLVTLLGVTSAFPMAFPVVVVGVALLARIQPLVARLRRLVRGRSRSTAAGGGSAPTQGTSGGSGLRP